MRRPLIALCLLLALALVAGCKRQRKIVMTAGSHCSSYQGNNCQLWVEDLDNPHQAHDAIVVRVGDQITVSTHGTGQGDKFVAHFIEINDDCSKPLDTPRIACTAIPTGGKQLLNPDPPSAAGFQMPPPGQHNKVQDIAKGACFKTVIEKSNGQCVDPHIIVCNAC